MSIDDLATTTHRAGQRAPDPGRAPLTAATAPQGGGSPIGGRARIQGRVHVSYPSWLRLVCTVIAVAHVAKFFPLVDFTLSQVQQQPELTAGMDQDLVVSALQVGVGVVVLFGASISCVALYAVTRSLIRRQTKTSPSTGSGVLTSRNRALVLAFSIALVLPDAWSVFGQIQPMVNPAFWAVLATGVVALTWRIGGPRLAATGLALAIGGVLL